jgi:GxxExxY protein
MIVAREEIPSDANDLIQKDEVYRIVGAAFAVLGELGPGLEEETYGNALAVEFGLKAIPCEQQRRYPITYKSVQVGEYVSDLIAFSSAIIHAKVIDQITDDDRSRMINALRITGLPVGVIFNFKRAKLEWERVFLSGYSHSSAALRGSV